MLTVFRRHLASCTHKKKGRKYRHCTCPLAVEGKLRGKMMRQSLDIRNWEAAQKLVREWESTGRAEVTLGDAVDRFLDDRKSMKLSDAMMRKYRNVAEELKRMGETISLRSLSVDDVRKLREGWKLAPITMQKRMEMVRKFFSFCEDSDWIEKNPAKKVAMPAAEFIPTLPFSEEEMEKILWAAEYIRVAHPKIPETTAKKLLALVLLMRWSGLRISDACMFRKSYLNKGKIFLRQEKTKQSVWVPVPDDVTAALDACHEGDDRLFYNGKGKPKSCITEWQQRLRLVFDFAGLPDGHSHRLRDTFAVALLEKGTPIEHVSKLLGHKSIKTTQKHYAPHVKSLQDALEAAVMATW